MLLFQFYGRFVNFCSLVIFEARMCNVLVNLQELCNWQVRKKKRMPIGWFSSYIDVWRELMNQLSKLGLFLRSPRHAEKSLDMLDFSPRSMTWCQDDEDLPKRQQSNKIFVFEICSSLWFLDTEEPFRKKIRQEGRDSKHWVLEIE